MSTQTDFENLIYQLKLSPFQAREIYLHRNEYNLSRIEVRGNVVFVPRVQSVAGRVFRGASGDVIGKDKIFLRGARRVRLMSGGYYSGCVGKKTHMGTPDGVPLSPDEFNDIVR